MQGYSDLIFYCLGASAAGFEWQTLQTTARRRPVLRGFAMLRRRRTFRRPKPLRPVAPHKAIALKEKPPRRHAQRQNSLPSLACFGQFARQLGHPKNPSKRRRSSRPTLARFVASSCRFIQPCKAALVAASRCASGRQSRRPCGARAAGRQAPCPPLYGGPLPSLWPQTSAGKAVCRPLDGGKPLPQAASAAFSADRAAIVDES